MSTAWIIGYAIGLVVVVIVATLAIILILQTRKISQQAGDIIAALEADEANTAGLWNVADVNDQLQRTLASAKTARKVAGG